MEKLERYLRFIREAERLKDVLRTAHTSTGRHESTAEHSWRLALLAAVLTGERPRLDMQRVLLMCLVHERTTEISRPWHRWPTVPRKLRSWSQSTN